MADPIVTLEGIDLGDLVIIDEFDFSPVSAQVSETIGGGLVIWEQTRSGAPLDLAGGPDFGWLTRSVLLQVKVLSAVPNATYTLIFNGATRRVRFRHEAGAPVSATPLVARPNHSDTDYYNNVQIKLMEV
jgi:hypothetical protein